MWQKKKRNEAEGRKGGVENQIEKGCQASQEVLSDAEGQADFRKGKA